MEYLLCNNISLISTNIKKETVKGGFEGKNQLITECVPSMLSTAVIAGSERQNKRHKK